MEEKLILSYIANLLDPEGEHPHSLSPDDMIRSLIIQYFHQNKDLVLRIADAGNNTLSLRSIANVTKPAE